jgi:hypothetical protein
VRRLRDQRGVVLPGALAVEAEVLGAIGDETIVIQTLTEVITATIVVAVPR